MDKAIVLYKFGTNRQKPMNMVGLTTNERNQEILYNELQIRDDDSPASFQPPQPPPLGGRPRSDNDVGSPSIQVC